MKTPIQGLMAGMSPDEQAESDASQVAVGEPDDGDENDERPNVTPEEQAAYNTFVTAGFDLIYEGGKVQAGIVKLLDDDPADLIAVLGDAVPEMKDGFTPIIALAATTVIVVMEVAQRLPEKPDGEILMHGGKALLEDLAEIAETISGKAFSQDELNQAFLHAVDLYQAVGSAQGTIDHEGASQEFADILNAEEEGRLGEVLPELEGAE